MQELNEAAASRDLVLIGFTCFVCRALFSWRHGWRQIV